MRSRFDVFTPAEQSAIIEALTHQLSRARQMAATIQKFHPGTFTDESLGVTRLESLIREWETGQEPTPIDQHHTLHTAERNKTK